MAGYRAWHSDTANLLGWALSVTLARRHFTGTRLVTDGPGARLLVDGLGLAFDEVTTDLDRLGACDPHWWVTGKLAAYAGQTEPFVHIDSDVFLWRPLPPEVLDAGVLFQNPEYFVPGAPESYYEPQVAEAYLMAGGWLPDEWLWWRAAGAVQWAACCGIVGGHDVALLRRYARTALATLLHARNRDPLRRLAAHGIHHNVLFEQYLLAAFLERNAANLRGPVRFLFDDQASAFDPDAGERTGFTHLMGTAKQAPDAVERLLVRAREHCPLLADRAVAIGSGGLLPVLV